LTFEYLTQIEARCQKEKVDSQKQFTGRWQTPSAGEKTKQKVF